MNLICNLVYVKNQYIHYRKIQLLLTQMEYHHRKVAELYVARLL